MMGIIEKDAQYIWHPYTQMQTARPAIPIVSANGVYLIAEDGNKYLDGISSWWTNIHGHANEYIARKVFAQLMTLEHVLFAGFTHAPAVELAERLLQKLPANQQKIFYSDNGSTAVEVALKMALQYWYNKGVKRTKIIAFEGAYHGDTFGAMSVSGRSIFTKPFNDHLFDVVFVPVPAPGYEEESFTVLQAAIAQHGADIAAFIFEPLVQGTAGMVMYDALWLDKILTLCKAHNIITIADEVMTGFARTGKFFACDYLQNEPDIVCLSKGITGGTMAMGVTTCTDAIYAAFLSADKTKVLFHGHSYTANPTSCAAALASLDLMEREDTWQAIARINMQHLGQYEKLKTHPGIKRISVTGTILVVEIKTANDSSYLSGIRDSLYEFFLSRNILLRPLGNIIYIMPPYCITNEELQTIYNAIEIAIDKFSSK
jgi:adenosylmethionine-8-amino-7-oxononanoate aminotransferase